MDHDKRRLLHGLGYCIAGTSLPLLHTASRAAEQGYPNKPVRMVIPGPPGGSADTLGRALADVMAKELGQPIVMDYRPGAGGTLAARHTAQAAADGYTLLFANTGPIFYAPFLYSQLGYDPAKDFSYISQVTDGGLILVVGRDVPANNLNELIAWVRQQAANTVHYASYGTASLSHMFGAYLSETQQLGMLHVPYKGEVPQLQDIAAGLVPMGIASVGSAVKLFQGGRIKPICVLSPKRPSVVPDVPTIAESGFPDPMYGVPSGMLMLAPPGLPPAILRRLDSAIRASLDSVQLQARLTLHGTVGVGNTSTEVYRVFETSRPLIERLVKLSGAKLD